MMSGAATRPSAGAHATTLEGILERITYVNEENAWSVVRLAVPGKKDLVTVVGNLLGVQPGENLRLRGSWSQDRKYGEQFKADGYVTVKPATLVGIEKYLGSGMVRLQPLPQGLFGLAAFGRPAVPLRRADRARERERGRYDEHARLRVDAISVVALHPILFRSPPYPSARSPSS